ncbi:MAG TPA: TIGR02996 domain-containing protein [Gemmata sp.]|nr:TIGR02996 domain-containing protein [Gemmata sp.]
MSDESHFIAAMAADPDDDTPRLVFADWLDEHGQPERAEFIRLQCRPDRDDPAVSRRNEELLQAHRGEWEAPLRALEAEVHFRRGFPYFLQVDIARLAEYLSILALAPDWHLILARDHDARDHDNGDPPPEPCSRLGSAPLSDRIRGLIFAWASWTWDELDAILTPPVIRAVRELRFGDDDAKEETLDWLVHLPLTLSVLGFGGDSYAGVGDEGCRVIANAPQFASLRGLELTNNEIGPDGVAALATSPYLCGLRDLDLAGGSNSANMIGPEGAAHIAESDNFHQLESLNLVFNGILDAGFVALAESPRLPALQSLNVHCNGVTDYGIRALARSEGLPALNWLNLCGARHDTGISAEGIRELVNSPRMNRLTGLKLASNQIGNEGAFALADAPAARNLRELLVTGCGISYDGFVRMLESPNLAGVREFHLFENPLTEDEAKSLKERYGGRVK